MTNKALRLSAGMQFARTELERQRSARDAARDAERRLAAAYASGLASIAEVHAAEAEKLQAEEKLATARKSFAEARKKFEPKFLESLAPTAAELRGALLAVADRLDAAIASAREADAFAIAHSLPVPQTVASTRRLAAIAAELRKAAA